MSPFFSLAGSMYSQDLVDGSYTGANPAPVRPNPNITLTSNGTAWTVTPANGYCGVQALEITAMTPINGTFQLQVGATTTAPIVFDSTNLAATAANIENGLAAAGLNVTSVSVDPSSLAPNFSFDVAFAGSQSPVAYLAATNPLPVAFSNNASAAAENQELTFTATGTSWDPTTYTSAVYRAFVPVFVAPPPPRIDSISAAGQTIGGSTADNNSSPATALAFHVTGVVARRHGVAL